MITCPKHPATRMTGPYCVDCLIDGLKAENANTVKTCEALERLLADVTGSPVEQAEQFIRERGRV